MQTDLISRNLVKVAEVIQRHEVDAICTVASLDKAIPVVSLFYVSTLVRCFGGRQAELREESTRMFYRIEVDGVLFTADQFLPRSLEHKSSWTRQSLPLPTSEMVAV